MAALLTAALATPAWAAPPRRLGHAGRWITDARGRVVVLHGTNMVYKLAPYYPAAAGFGDSDAAFLHRIGLDVVRVGVLWEALEPQPGVYDDAYLHHIAATVATLARHGIVSLLDFHQDMYNETFQGEGFPAWAVESDGLPNVPKLGFPDNYFVNPALHRAFENFWADRPGPGGVGLQERYAAAWRHVAQRFRSARGVLGYEIMNEPFPGGDYLTCASPAGCPASDAELTGLEHKVDRAIRGVDRRTLVFYEPYVTFNFGYPDHVGSLGDPRAVFAWHDYCLTNEAAGCSSQARTMSNAAAHVAQTGEGSFMTEFGATTSQTDLDRMVSLADQNMVPWTEWSYCTCGDPTGAPDEGLVLDPTKPKTAANLSTPILRSLVEPYPRVVAGIPLAWGFARSTRTFQLRYRTARASGHGSFHAGALTEISVPGLVFGRRYAVRVKGGAIVSAAGAPVLEIAACRGARSIDVEVGPGRRRAGSCRLHRHRRRARH